MSASKRRIEGFRYLYQRGRSFEVRVQVPRPLRAAVGKGELKQSLGGDFKKASRDYHKAVVKFLDLISDARGEGMPSPSEPATLIAPTRDAIEVAAYAHFSRMVSALRGKAISPQGDGGRSRSERESGFQAMLEHQIDAAEAEAWSTMSAQAAWLCEEQGWELTSDSPNFNYLCQTLMRARIQAYKNELRKLKGQFSSDPDPDPIFGLHPPQRDTKAATLGGLKMKFEEEREARWSASTRKNYSICPPSAPMAQI